MRKDRPAGRAGGVGNGAQPSPSDMQQLIGLFRSGRLQDAEVQARQMIERYPDALVLFDVLGAALAGQGKLEDAADSCRQALQVNPGYFVAHNNLGNVLKDQGKLDEAAASYRQALEINSGYVEAHSNLGNVLNKLGKAEEAEQSLRRALEIKPDFAPAHNNLGIVLNGQGRHEEAIGHLEHVLARAPKSADALVNLGNAQSALKRHREAVATYKKALASRPGFAEAHSNLGAALAALEKHEEAVASCRQALAIDPDFVDAHYNLGKALMALKRFPEAQSSYGKVLALDPEHSEALGLSMSMARNICDWSAFAENLRDLSAGVQAGRLIVDPGVFVSISDTPEDHLQCAKAYLADTIGTGVSPVAPKARRDDERVRVAYLSGDFRSHPVAYLAVELFELHDRDRFEIVGISWGADDNSPIRRRLWKAFDDVVEVQDHDDRAVAELVADRGIHIAVDLMGYTMDYRPGIFARRPAPIQVNYLGYPGTMGADFMDYIVVDPFVAPPGEELHYAEKLVRVPDCYQVNDRKRSVADHTPSRAEAGLPDAGFVFCCFNQNYKIAPAIFDIWMRLLTATPGSVLWLLRDNEAAEQNLREEAKARGVDPARLVFAPRVAIEDHLARQRRADLFLDTLPYNAHTSASDALWNGLPIVTCPGRSFAGRVAGSILHAMDMPELVTDSLEVYEALALKLTREPELLAKLREKIALNRDRAALFDSERFCRNLEAAYQVMFETWRAGEPARPIAVEAPMGG